MRASGCSTAQPQFFTEDATPRAGEARAALSRPLPHRSRCLLCRSAGAHATASDAAARCARCRAHSPSAARLSRAAARTAFGVEPETSTHEACGAVHTSTTGLAVAATGDTFRVLTETIAACARGAGRCERARATGFADSAARLTLGATLREDAAGARAGARVLATAGLVGAATRCAHARAALTGARET